jgi:site-specific recombinase XerC
MPRPRTGTLIKTKSGSYSAKVWTTVNGKPARVTRDLGTTVKALAKKRLAALIETAGPLPTKATAETFEAAAWRINDLREREGITAAPDELTRLRKWAFPEFGDVPVNAVKPAHVNAALDACKADGKSRQTAAHLLNAIRVTFRALVREGAIDANPADHGAVAMPRFAPVARKERAVLTDAELEVFVLWDHPVPEMRVNVLERQVMAAVARTFGGLRTGDLHALKWEGFDLPTTREPGHGFKWGWAPRQKTRRPQRLAMPPLGGGALWQWWEHCGFPTEGLVFPSRRGDRAGEAKIKVSHARAFRRDLRRAFGIERWDPKRGAFVPAREMTQRERSLLEGDEWTLPVDWHSWRRAYSQALADADVSAQQASALAGHASLAAHSRYLMRSERTVRAPDAAMPRIFQNLSAPETKPADGGVDSGENLNDFSGADGTRTRGLRRDRGLSESVAATIRARNAEKHGQNEGAD